MCSPWEGDGPLTTAWLVAEINNWPLAGNRALFQVTGHWYWPPQGGTLDTNVDKGLTKVCV